jgi:hypothetical protein
MSFWDFLNPSHNVSNAMKRANAAALNKAKTAHGEAMSFKLNSRNADQIRAIAHKRNQHVDAVMREMIQDYAHKHNV